MKVDTIQAGDFLRLSAQRFADRDCFVFDDRSSRSFGETNRRVNQLAGALHRRGVRKGDRVAILATDSGEYVEVLMACMKLGVVYVPLNNRLADAEVLTLLRRAEPKAVFASARYASRVAALAAELTGIGFLSSLDGGDLIPFAEFRYTASPTFHIAGQAMILMHVQRGFPTLILPQFEEGAVLRWMQSGRHAATSRRSVPSPAGRPPAGTARRTP